MRVYKCYPIGKPEEAQEIPVLDSKGYIEGLMPNTEYHVERNGHSKKMMTDSEGRIRIGAGYGMGF
ncbi:MAG: hypothetical protein OXI72_17340 [Gemmatimonadota bacterium]|nr:hypothetical protein [Gemmatimonadota bacterium]